MEVALSGTLTLAYLLGILVTGAVQHQEPTITHVVGEVSTTLPVARVALAETVAPDQQRIEAASIQYDLPFYSQFDDITSPVWQPRGCGIASLAMIIEYYAPGVTTPDALLQQGIVRGGYIDNVGWIHRDLAQLAEQYGIRSTSHDLAGHTAAHALRDLFDSLHEGPVIASVHHEFDPSSTIPHLIVVSGIEGNRLRYHDPDGGIGSISLAQFLAAWKQRYIAFSAF